MSKREFLKLFVLRESDIVNDVNASVWHVSEEVSWQLRWRPFCRLSLRKKKIVCETGTVHCMGIAYCDPGRCMK